MLNIFIAKKKKYLLKALKKFKVWFIKLESSTKIVNVIPLVLIILYKKLISPFLRPSCRFYPSCSQYSYEAFTKHNFVKAGFLSVKRISKCHPYHPGGYDPVK